MGCSSGKASAPARKATGVGGTLLGSGSDVKSPKAAESGLTIEQMPNPKSRSEMTTAEVLQPSVKPTGGDASTDAVADPCTAETTKLPTSRVHKNPRGWEEEGILFPHEGVRFLMQELCTAVHEMDPLPAWKWQNLATWYQEYFYDVVHHHHDAEEKIYLPWIQTRATVPTKITADHPELMQEMDMLRDMLKAGIAMPASERAEHLAQVRNRVLAFVDDMQEHLAEEEEVIPRLLREAGFTHEEEGAVVGQIIQGLGLDGNKKGLPPMLHALAFWAGPEKAEAFVTGNLPLPIQFLYRHFWLRDFEHRHMGLLASLPEGVVNDPFTSKWCC